MPNLHLSSTDVLVCIQLFTEGDVLWGWMMLIFVCAPAVMMSVFSLTWHYHDKSVTPAVLVMHLLLLAPIERLLLFLCDLY